MIYTDDVGTAAVFREILSNANNEADDFSFARSPAKTWKRRNTVMNQTHATFLSAQAHAHVLATKQGRIGVGAFRTTLKIGSYTSGFNYPNEPYVFSYVCQSCLFVDNRQSWRQAARFSAQSSRGMLRGFGYATEPCKTKEGATTERAPR